VIGNTVTFKALLPKTNWFSRFAPVSVGLNKTSKCVLVVVNLCLKTLRQAKAYRTFGVFGRRVANDYNARLSVIELKSACRDEHPRDAVPSLSNQQSYLFTALTRGTI
jgi:hypothetical protein